MGKKIILMIFFMFLFLITGCAYIDNGDGHRLLPWDAYELLDKVLEVYNTGDYTNNFNYSYTEEPHRIYIRIDEDVKEFTEEDSQYIKTYKDGILTTEHLITHDVTETNYSFEDFYYLYMIDDTFEIVDAILNNEDITVYAIETPYEKFLKIEINENDLVDIGIIEEDTIVKISIYFDLDDNINYIQLEIINSDCSVLFFNYLNNNSRSS